MHDRDVGEVESAHRPGSRTRRLQDVRERLLRDLGVVRLRHDRDLGNRKPWANVDRCLAAEHMVEIVEERRRGGNDRLQRLRQGACGIGCWRGAIPCSELSCEYPLTRTPSPEATRSAAAHANGGAEAGGVCLPSDERSCCASVPFAW